MMTCCVIPRHINLGPHMSMFLNENLFSATCDYLKKLENISQKNPNQLVFFWPKPYKLHISQFCPISLKI
jgi:hypothetical protein